MCGIAGVMFWGPRPAGVDPAERVSTMIAAMSHRGPDGRGVATCAAPDGAHPMLDVALGHARLAVLDLTERAAQPMQRAPLPHWIVFNGEIDNFRELRAELAALGHRFESASDTEVLLRGYQAWGRAVLRRIDGMFAFAIWDGARRELFLARDRFGIKPLYVHRSGGRLVFGSEIRALLASGLVERRLDRPAVDRFLAYQTVPAPRTLIDGVHLLEPGTAVVVSARGTAVRERYWDLLDAAGAVPAPASPDVMHTGVRARLEQAVRRQMVSDVPIGVFLSGGVDSAAVVALARQSNRRLRTFTVTLPGSPLDEAADARRLASACDTDHAEIQLAPEAVRAAVPRMLAAVDHPSADGLNTFIVAEAARAAGITVALSGLGGDEIFGGYPSFGRLRRLARYAGVLRLSPHAVRRAAAAAVRTMGGGSIASAKAAAVLETDATISRAYPILRQLFDATQRRALLGDAWSAGGGDDGDPYIDLLADAARRHPDAPVTTMVSFAEARTYMHDVLLRDADQMSMAHGLELRVPLLDHDLAAFAVALPENVKIGGGTPKRLLVESLGGLLPADVAARPKRGFVLPFDRWMREELRPLCESALRPANGMGVFDRRAVDALWTSFLANDGRTSWSRPWALVAMHAWMESNGVSL